VGVFFSELSVDYFGHESFEAVDYTGTNNQPSVIATSEPVSKYYIEKLGKVLNLLVIAVLESCTTRRPLMYHHVHSYRLPSSWNITVKRLTWLCLRLQQ